jgi:hypothetical protein
MRPPTGAGSTPAADARSRIVHASNPLRPKRPIQVHGGYGYSSEYEVEQHYRDNRLNAIHEGTHGIQALDLLGRKTTMADGAALRLLVDAVTDTVRQASDLGGEPAGLGERLRVALDDVCEVTRILHGADDAAALANATIYLEATGHVVVAWLWLEQFLAALDGDEPFHEGKRQAARFFFRHELPRTAPQFDSLRRVDRTVLDTAPELF